MKKLVLGLLEAVVLICLLLLALEAVVYEHKYFLSCMDISAFVKIFPRIEEWGTLVFPWLCFALNSSICLFGYWKFHSWLRRKISPNKRPSEYKLNEIDAPILTYKEDQLDMADFAAGFLKQLYYTEERIIGLVGAWGAGKTSLLNIMQSFLKATDKNEITKFEQKYGKDFVLLKDRIRFLHFSCLEVLQGQSVMGAMLRSISVDKALDMKDIAIILADLADLFDSPCTKSISLALKLLYRSKDGLSVAQQNLYDKLNQALEEKCCKLIFIADDIGRLPPEDAKRVLLELYGMCKLKNVVCVLPYDEEHFTISIGLAMGISSKEEAKDYGKTYLEKLVPYEQTLPPVSVRKLIRLNVAQLIKTQRMRVRDNQFATTLHPSQTSLKKILGWLETTFQTPHDVRRFFGRLTTDLEPVLLNIHLLNYIAVQLIRWRWSLVYDYMKNNIEKVLTDTHSFNSSAMEEFLHKSIHFFGRKMVKVQHQHMANWLVFYLICYKDQQIHRKLMRPMR